MKVCGACERKLPDDAYSVEQWGLRQGTRRCIECVATENELVLMKRGRTRAEEDTCPLCELPLPVEPHECMLRPCCMKKVCNGCILSANKFGIRDCPFCRAATPGESQVLAMVKKRAAADDPMAICFLGAHHDSGGFGLEKETRKAVRLCGQAAALGAKEAHYILGGIYKRGVGGLGSIKEGAMSFQHYEEAAMRGHVLARYTLGVLECKDRHWGLAIQHFSISAKMGHAASIHNIKQLFIQGIATKAAYAEVLQGYGAATEEMSSPSRDEARVMGAEKICHGDRN